MDKAIIFVIGIGLLVFLNLVHNVMIKPTYNKMHNMWHDDPESKHYAQLILVTMLVISFILGAIAF